MQHALGDPDAAGSDHDSSDGDSVQGSDDDDPDADGQAAAGGGGGGQLSVVDIVLTVVESFAEHADSLAEQLHADGAAPQAAFAEQMADAGAHLAELLHQAVHADQVIL